MQTPQYYRHEAARAQRLANAINHPEVRDTLLKMAKDYDELAMDLETGGIEIRHPELLPQAGRR
jgi:hypothetical protein